MAPRTYVLSCPTLWPREPLQAPLSMGFSRQEFCSGLPCPLPGDLLNPEIEPVSPPTPVLAGGFFTTSTPGEAKAGDPPPSHSDGRSPVLWLSSALGIVGGIQAAHMWGARGQGPQCRLSISRWGGRWCWCFVGSPAAPTPCLCQPSPWALPGTPGSALSSQCPPPAPRPRAVVSHLPNQTPPAREAA